MVSFIIFDKSASEIIPISTFIAGVFVPDSIIDRMANTDNKVETCKEIASELLEDVKPYCAGIHIQALGWEKHIPSILKDIN